MERSQQAFIPFLCEATPNSLGFLLSLCPLRPLRFVLYIVWSLAHLHTELVLPPRLRLLLSSCDRLT
ncbi:MAG: hypothetical protein RMY33_013420 [Nostoc sp. DedQUE03]|nr:hypothetical protein [Nostoc sp. DedQUE02]